MKQSPSFLFASIILAAFFQAGNVAGATRMLLPFTSKGLHGYDGSRATGDIELLGADPNFQCPEGTSVAPHPEKCELYYTCYFASPVTLRQCSSNYLFDVTYNGCNYPELTDCGNRQRPVPTITMTRTKTATDSPPSTSPVFNCPSEGGFFPVSPEECYQHYYTCAGGVAYVMLCPTDGLFDPVTLTCKPANEVSCKDPAFTCTADGFYPIEGECTGVYFVCASGVAYESVCPNNGIFDPDRGICASPDTVPCAQGPTTRTSTTTSSTTTPSTTTSSTTTPSTTTTSTTPSTTTSTTTTTTTTPRTTSTTTPTTTSTTTTTPRTTSTTTTPTTTTPSGEFNCPNKDGKYPDPTNCHAYYVCISGVAFPSNCPENGCFDAPSQKCSTDCSNCIDFFYGFF